MFPDNMSIFDFYNSKNFENQKYSIEHVDFVKNLIKDKKLIILETHDEIVEYINDGDTIINIDHHHDLLYNKEGLTVIKKWDFSLPEEKEAVWALFCIMNKNIVYYWCKNNNSYEDMNLYGIKFEYIDEKSILDLRDKYDIIYLVKSKNYVTQKQLSEVGDIIGRELS